jgi:putative peptidoglycan lipid II flippase
MWAPILNNLVGVVLLGGFLYYVPNISADTITDTQVAVLGWGTTLGVVVQALVLIPVIARTKIKLRLRFGFAGLGKSFRLAGWTLVYCYQRCGSKRSRGNRSRCWFYSL